MALEFGEKLRNIVRDNAQTMTMIAQARKFMRPDISDYAEDKKTIMAKRRCCHMIIDNNDIKLAVVPVGDSKYFLVSVVIKQLSVFYKCVSRRRSFTVLTGLNVEIGTSMNIVFQSDIAPFHNPGRSNALSTLPLFDFSEINPVFLSIKSGRL